MMNRQAIIEHTVSVLSQLPDDGSAEVADFADFVMSRYQLRSTQSLAGKEHKDWHAQALAQMDRSYATNEPDYSDALLSEPNPNYEVS